MGLSLYFVLWLLSEGTGSFAVASDLPTEANTLEGHTFLQAHE